VENASNPSNAPADYHPATTAEEVLRRYQAGERFFRNTDLPGGSSFRDAVLTGSDFKNSFLSEIDFQRADLRQVCFDESNVKLSDFQGADLRDASFRGSALCSAMFAGAKVDGVCTEDATYYGAAVTDIRELVEPESFDQ
jgi:uncharacterized protein YjbI with pentapeptide repeats